MSRHSSTTLVAATAFVALVIGIDLTSEATANVRVLHIPRHQVQDASRKLHVTLNFEHLFDPSIDFGPQHNPFIETTPVALKRRRYLARLNDRGFLAQPLRAA